MPATERILSRTSRLTSKSALREKRGTKTRKPLRLRVFFSPGRPRPALTAFDHPGPLKQISRGADISCNRQLDSRNREH